MILRLMIDKTTNYFLFKKKKIKVWGKKKKKIDRGKYLNYVAGG